MKRTQTSQSTRIAQCLLTIKKYGPEKSRLSRLPGDNQ